MLLYGSAVLVPQLAQQQLGYTATLAGLVLSPGAILITLTIPLIGRAMPYVQTRFIVAAGFLLMGCAMLYSRRLVPNMDYFSLVMVRSSQSLAIGFLFVPVTTLAYVSLPKRMNGDATALFTMFRNVAGSIGISLSTALVTNRSQVHMAYLGQHMSPLSASYTEALQRVTESIQQGGSVLAQAGQAASGYLYQSLIAQSVILSYIDVFGLYALVAFAFVPFTFLFTPAKSAGSGEH